MEAPILMYDPEQPLSLDTDALNQLRSGSWSVCWELQQSCPVTYRNSAHNHWTRSPCYCLGHWWWSPLFVWMPFQVVTDHHGLCSLKVKNPSNRLAQWIMKFQVFLTGGIQKRETACRCWHPAQEPTALMRKPTQWRWCILILLFPGELG